MTTPTREEVLVKASELWHKGNREFESEPELCEVKEEGCFNDAKLRLMTNRARDFEGQWKAYNRENSVIKTEIPFSVEEAMQSGFFISGTRQMTGKTNLAKHLVSSLIQSGTTVYVLDVSKAWTHDTPINNVVPVPNGVSMLDLKRENTIFDMSSLTLLERLYFVNNFASVIYRSHVQGFSTPELIVFEEAQTYLPNGCMRSLRLYMPVVDYITVGGNFKTSFGLITQFPSMVDKAPVKAAQQRYFGLSTEFNDKQYVKSFIGKENLGELANLQLGQFLYQNRGSVTKFQCAKFEAAKVEKQSYSYQYGYVVA